MSKYRYKQYNRLFGKPLYVLQVNQPVEKGEYVAHDGDTVAPPNWNAKELLDNWQNATIQDVCDKETRIKTIKRFYEQTIKEYNKNPSDNLLGRLEGYKSCLILLGEE